MNDDTAYQETLDYLYSFIDYSLQRTFQYSPEKFDLSRMRAFMARLGNPHLAYPVIHVAGTKGKGSVASLCASALHASGLKVGLYTSPHLQDYVERIQVDGEAISHAELAAIVNELKPDIEAVPELTTFEITTGLAFVYFARKSVEAAVIEVGLGGRLDATNIVDPLVTVITSISYDHTAILGNTLTEIAGEKAGIIKPGKPVVVAPQKEEAERTISRIAAERSAPLIQVGRDYLFSLTSRSLKGQVFDVWAGGEQEGGEEPVRLDIPLLGTHQVDNAATAYAALQVAMQAGLPVTGAGIRSGFESVRWPGRFELLQEEPPIIVDSAHNRDSTLHLRQTLEEYFPGRPTILILGASEDKDIQGMVAELMPRASHVIATQSIHPRAADAAALADSVRQYGRPAEAVAKVEEALDRALLLADSQGMVVAAGSIFLAAAVRSAWYERHSRLLVNDERLEI
jgi:dihydrofolate synthase / folylpolyglutamate synthase